MNSFTAAVTGRCRDHPENHINIHSHCIYTEKYNIWIFLLWHANQSELKSDHRVLAESAHPLDVLRTC